MSDVVEAVRVVAPTTNRSLIAVIAGSLTADANDRDTGITTAGAVWVRFEAYGADFGVSMSGVTAATTSNTENGQRLLGTLSLTATSAPGAGVAETRCQFVVPNGSYRDFHVGKNSRYYRVIASAAAGTLRVSKVG